MIDNVILVGIVISILINVLLWRFPATNNEAKLLAIRITELKQQNEVHQLLVKNMDFVVGNYRAVLKAVRNATGVSLDVRRRIDNFLAKGTDNDA
jgi:prepilin signal peptidase PulO-like enzyme (type II secretory pathway)